MSNTLISIVHVWKLCSSFSLILKIGKNCSHLHKANNKVIEANNRMTPHIKGQCLLGWYSPRPGFCGGSNWRPATSDFIVLNIQEISYFVNKIDNNRWPLAYSRHKDDRYLVKCSPSLEMSDSLYIFLRI